MKVASPEDKGSYLEYKVVETLREVYGSHARMSQARLRINAIKKNDIIGDAGVDVTATVWIGNKNYLIFVQCKNYYNGNNISSETVDALKGNMTDLPSSDVIGIVIVGLETGIPERIACQFDQNGMIIGSNVPIMLMRIDMFIEKFEENVLRLESEGKLLRFSEVSESEEMIYQNPGTILRNVEGLVVDQNGNVVRFEKVGEVNIGFMGVRKLKKNYINYVHTSGNL